VAARSAMNNHVLVRWASVAILLLALAWQPATIAAKRKSTSPAIELNEGFFEHWNSFKELEQFVSLLSKRFKSTKMIKVTSIGKSAEHRSLHLLTIGPANAKHQVMMMATMHGREWITPHAVLYTTWKLLQGFEEHDPKVMALLKDTQVHILPVLNPDGYEYTRTPPEKSADAREWRKNRRNLCSKCERAVHGIDLNRNWGIQGKSWGFGAQRATSEVYQGKRPFSEPEIKAVRDWLLKHNRGKAINGFMDVHCCSGMVLPPFYYRDEPEDVRAKNLANSAEIARAMKSVNKFKYKSRPREADFSDSNTGIGLDWIYAEGGVQNAFMIETRGNKTKLLKYIFEVPESLILPISKELEAGFWKMVEIVVPQSDSTQDPASTEVGSQSGASVQVVAMQDTPVSPGTATLSDNEAHAEISPEDMSLEDLINNFASSLDDTKKEPVQSAPGLPPDLLDLNDVDSNVEEEKVETISKVTQEEDIEPEKVKIDANEDEPEEPVQRSEPSELELFDSGDSGSASEASESDGKGLNEKEEDEEKEEDVDEEKEEREEGEGSDSAFLEEDPDDLPAVDEMDTDLQSDKPKQTLTHLKNDEASTLDDTVDFLTQDEEPNHQQENNDLDAAFEDTAQLDNAGKVSQEQMDNEQEPNLESKRGNIATEVDVYKEATDVDEIQLERDAAALLGEDQESENELPSNAHLRAKYQDLLNSPVPDLPPSRLTKVLRVGAVFVLGTIGILLIRRRLQSKFRQTKEK